MSDLPQLDPAKLYTRAIQQVNMLNDQNLQMDALIEALKEERDAALRERDEAKLELKNLLGMTEQAVIQGDVEKTQ